MDIGLSPALQHNWSPASPLAEVLAKGAEVLRRQISGGTATRESLGEFLRQLTDKCSLPPCRFSALPASGRRRTT